MGQDYRDACSYDGVFLHQGIGSMKKRGSGPDFISVLRGENPGPTQTVAAAGVLLKGFCLLERFYAQRVEEPFI